MVITKRQRLYAEARASGQRKKDAALSAGCPERTASQAANSLEKHPNVRAHWERIGFCPAETKAPAAAQAAAGRIAERASEDASDRFECPLDYMRHVMNATQEDPKLRLDSAKALAAYTVAKPGDKGKKEERQERAKEAANRFAAPSPPKLKSVK